MKKSVGIELIGVAVVAIATAVPVVVAAAKAWKQSTKMTVESLEYSIRIYENELTKLEEGTEEYKLVEGRINKTKDSIKKVKRYPF